MRTRAERKFVAKATALGARVPQAELFVLDCLAAHIQQRVGVALLVNVCPFINMKAHMFIKS